MMLWVMNSTIPANTFRQYCSTPVILCSVPNYIDVRCSDDRSPEVFLRSIEAATQMKAVLAPDSRPNCLIIDEIDGAPTVSVHSCLCRVHVSLWPVVVEWLVKVKPEFNCLHAYLIMCVVTCIKLTL